MSVHRDGPCACGSGKKYKNCCLRREHREAQRTSQHATAFVTLGGDTRRSLLAINIGEAKNRIEPFARTLRFADEGKAWLQQLAGDSIRYLDREVVDPVTILSDRDRSSGSGERRASESPIPPAQQTRMYQEFYERHYRNWADEPIPALVIEPRARPSRRSPDAWP